MADDRGLILAVPALQRVDPRQALLRSEQRRRVVIGAVGVPAHVRGRVLQLRLQAHEPLGDRFETRIDSRQRAGFADPAREGISGAAPLPVQRGTNGRCAASDRLAVPGKLEARPQLLRLADPQARPGDLLDLVAEQLHSPLHLARVDREPGELRPVLAPARDRPGDLGARAVVAAERVEELALPALVEEA